MSAELAQLAGFLGSVMEQVQQRAEQLDSSSGGLGFSRSGSA